MHEWVYYEMMASNFNNCTNNRLECVNGKIKFNIETPQYFVGFIESIFTYVEGSQYEKDVVAANTVMKRSTLSLKLPLQEYANKLTPYAFAYAKRQYLDMTNVIPQGCRVLESGAYELKAAGRTKICSADSCSCTEFHSMKLPCKHILLIRKKEKKPLFDSSLFSERWSKEYYNKHQ